MADLGRIILNIQNQNCKLLKRLTKLEKHTQNQTKQATKSCESCGHLQTGKNNDSTHFDKNACDPDNCAFHTAMTNGSDAGCVAKPGSVLGYTHGIVSDIVSDLITKSYLSSGQTYAQTLTQTKDEDAKEQSREFEFELTVHDPNPEHIVPIDLPQDDISLEQPFEQYTHNQIPLDANWQIDDVPDAAHLSDPRKIETKPYKIKLSDRNSKFYQDKVRGFNKQNVITRKDLSKKQNVKYVNGNFVNMIDIQLPKKFINSDSVAQNDAIDLPCINASDTLFDDNKIETEPTQCKSMEKVVEDHPLIYPRQKYCKVEKANAKSKIIVDENKTRKDGIKYTFVNQNQ